MPSCAVWQNISWRLWSHDCMFFGFQSTEDTDEVVVQKGIEMWSQDGGLLLPHLDPVSGLRSQPIVPQLIAAVKFPMVAQIKIDMSEGSIIEEEN